MPAADLPPATRVGGAGAAARSRYRSIVGRGAFALILLSGGGAAPVRAQFTVDVSGVAIERDDLPRRYGSQFAPLLRRSTAHLYAEGGVSLATYDDGSWNGDGAGLVVWRPGRTDRPGVELLGGAGFTAIDGSDGSRTAWGRGRWHLPWGAADLYLGAGGALSDAAVRQVHITNLDAGVLWYHERLNALLATTPTWVSDGERFMDATLTVRWTGAVLLGGTVGFRQRWAPVVDDLAWLSASVERPVGSRVSVVVAAGTYPTDLVQGFSEGRYATVGLRFGLQERSLGGPPLTARAPTATPPWPGAAFEMRQMRDGTIEFLVSAPTAKDVELTGDITEWRPLRLSSVGGRWRLRLRLTPGIHRLNLRIDRGAWQVPPGLRAVEDDFGGSAGILVVN